MSFLRDCLTFSTEFPSHDVFQRVFQLSVELLQGFQKRRDKDTE